MVKRIIFIGGAEGTGKTTLTHLLRDNLENSEAYSFFKMIGDEGDKLNLSQADKLRNWGSLQEHFFESFIVSRLINSDDKTIIFDTHYSMQASDNPKIVFAKRSISEEHGFSMTFDSNFLIRLASINVPTVLFLVTSGEETIHSRIIKDSIRDNRVYKSSTTGVKREIDAELVFYRQSIAILEHYGSPVKHSEIVNYDNQQKISLFKMLERLN